jgi:molybdate transport system ATP-binding protein
VILSGYFDSIGIYQAVSDKQRKLVQNWLDILGIDKRTADAPFQLSCRGASSGWR